VRKGGNRLRITGQLIDTATGAHIGPTPSTVRSTTFSNFGTRLPPASSARSSPPMSEGPLERTGRANRERQLATRFGGSRAWFRMTH
jgi:hypothetical protein